MLVNQFNKFNGIRRALTYVGSRPGKQVPNFYNIDDEIMIVDAPGYGYAQRRDEIMNYGVIVDEYFN